MPGRTESTGHRPHEIYKEQYSSGGQYQVFTSGTRAIFESGAAAEFESGSTLDIESGALLKIAGIARVPSAGKIELKSGGEVELESGSTMNVESGGHINYHSGAIVNVSSGAYFKHRGVKNYTSDDLTIDPYDRISILRSTVNQEWTLAAPGTHIGLMKTIIFRSKKATTHDLVLHCPDTKKIVNFGATNIHCIQALSTNPHMLGFTTKGTAVSPLCVDLISASSASWMIISNLTTEKLAGALQATSSTGFV